jgi:branched-chain amino acid transport system permease protein
VASAYIERWNFVLGAIFVAIVIFMPEGLVPGSLRLWRWGTRRWWQRLAGPAAMAVVPPGNGNGDGQ